MTFFECVSVALNDHDLLAQFDRLNGTHLSTIPSRAPIDAMIDEATGRDHAAMQEFVTFVYEYVWTRLPATTNPPSNA